MLLRSEATLDHVKALGAGGYDKTKNGAIACRRCNARKGRMPAEEFINRQRQRIKNQSQISCKKKRRKGGHTD